MTRCAACGQLAPGRDVPPWDECTCFGGPRVEQRERRQQQDERDQRSKAEQRQGAV